MRPSIERLGTSVSTGGHGVLLNDDSSIDEGETVGNGQLLHMGELTHARSSR